MDNFPEAFQRFEDSKLGGITKEDTYESLCKEFEAWQYGKLSPKQTVAIQKEIRDYDIAIPKAKRVEAQVIRRRDREYYIVRDNKGRFKRVWTKRD